MRTSVIISLGASAVLGTAALLVARFFIAPPKPNAAKAPPVTTAPVVLADSAFKYGDQLDPKKLVVAQYPQNLVPPGSFQSISQISAGSSTPPVALAAIEAHQPILATEVSTTGGRKSVAILISPGMRAYTIHITDLTGVGGHVLPGDRVDVMLTRTPTTADTPGAVRALVTQVLIQDVRVLGINMNADPQAPASTAISNPSTATLEVTLQDAEKLAVASDSGILSFALRRTGAVEQINVRPTLVTALTVPGQGGPARRRAGQTPALPPGEPKSSVVVVSGATSTDVEVPIEGPGGILAP